MQYFAKVDKMGTKQFHLVCTFTLWCWFHLWNRPSQISVGIVKFSWLICSGHFSLGTMSLTLRDMNSAWGTLVWLGLVSFSLEDIVPHSGGHQFCLRDISVVHGGNSFHPWNKQYFAKVDKMGIKQFHLMCRFTLWCWFHLWSRPSEISVGIVEFSQLVCSGHLQPNFSSLKQAIPHQSGQNGYQTVPFDVYIHIMMLVSLVE